MTGFAQYPAANRHYQATVFGDGHELCWRQQPPFWMLPADERLDADDGAAVKVDFWLVMQHQFLPLQSQAQAGLNRLPLDGPIVHALLEKFVGVAPVVLGVI